MQPESVGESRQKVSWLHFRNRASFSAFVAEAEIDLRGQGDKLEENTRRKAE
jgi:hypothetical protein